LAAYLGDHEQIHLTERLTRRVFLEQQGYRVGHVAEGEPLIARDRQTAEKPAALRLQAFQLRADTVSAQKALAVCLRLGIAGFRGSIRRVSCSDKAKAEPPFPCRELVVDNRHLRFDERQNAFQLPPSETEKIA
jgi:hypothetical protein